MIDRFSLETAVRALGGMQKEAMIRVEPSGRTWRLISDEGPYLNGTDLAPFPLAFFTAGMQFSFLSRLLQIAGEREIEIRSLALSQYNHYSMNGSFLRGDATGGAMPAELHVTIESDASPEDMARTVHEAEASCPAQSVMRQALENTFALKIDGKDVALSRVRSSPEPTGAAPEQRFDEPGAVKATNDTDIISKLQTAEKVFGVEGGAGSSLQPEQKRTLLVRGEAKWIEGMLMESDIELLKPIGSTFRFRCDETRKSGGTESAPPPLAYLTAGMAFCYMTQIGRYAQIIKRELDSYGIVQHNVFRFTGSTTSETLSAIAEPVDTHVFIEGKQPDETAEDLVSTGERTCFLHAAMRGQYPSVLTANLNGEALPLD